MIMHSSKLFGWLKHTEVSLALTSKPTSEQKSINCLCSLVAHWTGIRNENCTLMKTSYFLCKVQARSLPGEKQHLHLVSPKCTTNGPLKCSNFALTCAIFTKMYNFFSFQIFHSIQIFFNLCCGDFSFIEEFDKSERTGCKTRLGHINFCENLIYIS